MRLTLTWGLLGPMPGILMMPHCFSRTSCRSRTLKVVRKGQTLVCKPPITS